MFVRSIGKRLTLLPFRPLHTIQKAFYPQTGHANKSEPHKPVDLKGHTTSEAHKPIDKEKKAAIIAAEQGHTSKISNASWSEAELKEIENAPRALLLTLDFKFHEYIEIPFVLAIPHDHPSDTNGAFCVSGRGILDTGAPYAGLIFAHNDPMIANAQGNWRKEDFVEFLDKPAAVEIAGQILEKVVIARSHHWDYQHQKIPVIGHDIIRRFMITITGDKLPGNQENEVWEKLRTPKKVIIHNGSDQKEEFSNFLHEFPEYNGKKNY